MLVETTLDEAGMTVVAMPTKRQEVEASAEHRHRMFLNVLSASFITLLMVTGYWVVTTLTGAV
jgi:hypothetical protein